AVPAASKRVLLVFERVEGEKGAAQPADATKLQQENAQLRRDLNRLRDELRQARQRLEDMQRQAGVERDGAGRAGAEALRERERAMAQAQAAMAAEAMARARAERARREIELALQARKRGDAADAQVNEKLTPEERQSTANLKKIGQALHAY